MDGAFFAFERLDESGDGFADRGRCSGVRTAGRGMERRLPIIGLRRAALAFAAAAMGGCTLPWQQLSLPTPPPPADAAADRRKPGGAPLAKISPGQRGGEVVGTGELTGSLVPRAVATPGKDGVTLSMVDASIAEAAKSILGDVLGVNYTVSEKLKGAITIQTAKAVPKEALLEIFEDVLRGEGAAIVVQQGTYRVLPAAKRPRCHPSRA